jgi:uncharacterized membrane protein YgdD (TMEM256/DUF423 family)
MQRDKLVAIGAFSAAFAVAAGAFAAHGLEGRLDAKSLEIFQTAARYQMYHALAICLAGVLRAPKPAWLFALGTVLFSGSLYVLALTGVTVLGAITPFGGLAFLVGWGWLGVSSLRARERGLSSR